MLTSSVHCSNGPARYFTIALSPSYAGSLGGASLSTKEGRREARKRQGRLTLWFAPPAGRPRSAYLQIARQRHRRAAGKDTTYVLDFVNDPTNVLAAFKVYYETADLADVRDPNLVFNLRVKLDATGHYDDFEVDHVVTVTEPARQRTH